MRRLPSCPGTGLAHHGWRRRTRSERRVVQIGSFPERVPAGGGWSAAVGVGHDVSHDEGDVFWFVAWAQVGERVELVGTTRSANSQTQSKLQQKSWPGPPTATDSATTSSPRPPRTPCWESGRSPCTPADIRQSSIPPGADRLSTSRSHRRAITAAVRCPAARARGAWLDSWLVVFSPLRLLRDYRQARGQRCLPLKRRNPPTAKVAMTKRRVEGA